MPAITSLFQLARSRKEGPSLLRSSLGIPPTATHTSSVMQPPHKETRNTISSCDQVLLPEKKGSLGISRQPATFAEGFGSPSQKSGHQPAPRGPAGCAAGGWGSGPPATSASPLPPWDEPPKGRPVHAPIPTLPSCILPLLLGSRPRPGQLTQARTEGSE